MVAAKFIPSKKVQLRLSLDRGTNDESTTNLTPKSPSTSTAIPAAAPYPSKQLLVLALCRFSEPVAMTSSFPYLFFMIRDFHLTDDEKKIGQYAGLLASCFSFAQFFSGSLLSV
jgi:hypothetical protein